MQLLTVTLKPEYPFPWFSFARSVWSLECPDSSTQRAIASIAPGILANINPIGWSIQRQCRRWPFPIPCRLMTASLFEPERWTVEQCAFDSQLLQRRPPRSGVEDVSPPHFHAVDLGTRCDQRVSSLTHLIGQSCQISGKRCTPARNS